MADSSVPIENVYILNLMGSYGPILIGSLLSCTLYGMGCIQLFLYYNHYERDSIWMKLYVALVWCFETASTICVLVALWPVLILKWGSLHELGLTQLPILHRVWLTGVETFLVHMFYIYRIYLVNGKKPLLPCLLIPITLYQMIETCIYAHTALRDVALSKLSGNLLTDLGLSGRAAIAFVDIAIVALMIHSLLKGGLPQFRSSRKIVFKLIVLTVNTGIWTAVFAIVDLALVGRYPNELYYCALDFPLTSLYLNSLLANLNAREAIRGTSSDVEHSYQLGDASHTVIRSRKATQGGEIHIQTSTDTQVKFDSDAMLRSKPVDF